MRQFLIPIFFFFTIFYASCANSQETFPDQINVTKTDNLKRIKGTKLFVSAPGNYHPIESMARMQRDENTYINVLDIANSNFLSFKSEFTKESIEAQGAKVDIVKPVKYNGYDAIYFSGPSKVDGSIKLGLAFGDNEFCVMIVGVCSISDKNAVGELNKIISTSYYDKSLKMDALELAFFKFDESVTGFKMATTTGNSFVYSPNGKDDLNKGREDLPTFVFVTFEATGFSKAKEFLDYIISRYEPQGTHLIGTAASREFLINGNQAYEVVMHAKDKNDIESDLYHVVIYNGTKSVAFMGSDTEKGKWFEKFKQTAASIKF